MKFTINLATRIYLNQAKLRLYAFLALVLLTGLLIFNVANLVSTFDQAGRIKADILQLENSRKAASSGVPDSEYKNLLERVRFANDIIEKKRYNWLTLLDKLEQVVPDGLAISSIQPDLKNQSVNLAGVTRNFSSLRTFMENLETSQFFSEIYLVSQTATKLGDGQGISFNLTCKAAMK